MTNGASKTWHPGLVHDRSGNAIDYWLYPSDIELQPFKNDGSSLPQAGDIIAFGPITTKGRSQYGHIAVVTAVSSTQVTIVEQNWDVTGTYNLALDGNQILPRYNKAKTRSRPILGWLRYNGASISITQTACTATLNLNCIYGGSYCYEYDLTAKGTATVPAGDIFSLQLDYPLTESFTVYCEQGENGSCLNIGTFHFANYDWVAGVRAESAPYAPPQLTNLNIEGDISTFDIFLGIPGKVIAKKTTTLTCTLNQ